MLMRSLIALFAMVMLSFWLWACVPKELDEPAPPQANGEEEPEAGPKRLPGIVGSQADCRPRGEPVELWEWMQASDAIVIGTVRELRALHDPALYVEGREQVLLPREECYSVTGSVVIDLIDVEILWGTAPRELIVMLGTATSLLIAGWTSVVAAHADGSVFLAPEGTEEGLAPGMRIGGALFHFDGLNYTFMSMSSQPFFDVDDRGAIRFQEVREACVGHIGPVHFDGVAEAELRQRVLEVATLVPEGSREENRLRQALGLDLEGRVESLFKGHHGDCWRENVPLAESCSMDSDCPSGKVCGEFWECVDP